MPKKIDSLIIHCSDSPWACAREIKKWHTDPKPEGRGWSDIGYHFVILNGRITAKQELAALDGSVECGRYLDEDNIIEPDEFGIHCLGYNDHSIGICLVGKTKFTDMQMAALKDLTLELCRLHDIHPEDVLGHCETESGKKEGKTCPNFSVEIVREYLRENL
jgi:hypothetical protein